MTIWSNWWKWMLMCLKDAEIGVHLYWQICFFTAFARWDWCRRRWSDQLWRVLYYDVYQVLTQIFNKSGQKYNLWHLDKVFFSISVILAKKRHTMQMLFSLHLSLINKVQLAPISLFNISSSPLQKYVHFNLHWFDWGKPG